jgi:hypothetical protein
MAGDHHVDPLLADLFEQRVKPWTAIPTAQRRGSSPLASNPAVRLDLDVGVLIGGRDGQ